MNSKIHGKFYPLTPETAKKLREAELTAAQWRLWSYLVEVDPFGDRYHDLPDTLTIMQEVGIKKSTYYAAIAKFQKLELFDFQNESFAIRNLQVSPKNRKVVRNFGNDSKNSESCPKFRKRFQEFGNDSKNSENQTPKTSDGKAYESSQTYSDYIQTLSEGEREENSVSQNSSPTQESSETNNNLVPSSSSSNSLVEDKNLGLDQKKPQNRSLVKSLNSNISNNDSDPRPQTYSDLIGALDESAQEKFLLFAKKKAASLPKPPTLSNRWIEKNFDELYEQWSASEQRRQENLALRTASLAESDQEARREDPSEKMVSLSGDLLRKLKEEVMKNV